MGIDKIQLLRVLSVVCAISVLFAPTDSKSWIYLLILAVVFGISWFKE